MKIPSPGELGLPEKFDAWRPKQMEALEWLWTRTKRVKAMSAPTGFGKTPVIIADALQSGEPTCFVTDSRSLQDQMMCIAPWMRVCTADLRWVPASTITAGDDLLGFDEFRTPNRRMWRPAMVYGVRKLRKLSYQLTLENGTKLECSSDHKWLTKKPNKAAEWVGTSDLIVGQCLLDVLDVWGPAKNDYDTGYLAAAFDGEGHLHQSESSHAGAPNGVDVNLSYAQADNEMLVEVRAALKRKGFDFTWTTDKKNSLNPKHRNCNRLTISHRREVLRFLGQIRPHRLLPRLNLNLMGMLNPARPVAVTSIEPIGIQDVLFIQTSTKTLVTEGIASHNSDFSSIGLVSIKGRRNYQCDMHPDDEDYTCESGYAAQCPYKGTLACPSSSAEMRAATSRLVVTNYDKWTSAKKYGQGMSHFSRLVLDEGHCAPEAVSRAMQVVIHHRERERHIAMDPPTLCDDISEWKRWACEARVQIESEIVRALSKIRGGGTPSPTAVRHYLHMRNLNRRLVTLSTCVPSTWVVEEIEKGFQFDTVRPGRYAESSLLLRVPSVLVVSATLRPKTLFMLGQAADSFDYREFDSEFDAKRNPIYWVPTMRVSGLGQNLAQLWTRHDQIAARRRDRNGIVHPISYSRGLELAQTSRFSSSMHLDTKEDQSAAVIERFRDSYPGAILVSPAVQQGHDFPMSEAEWQFIAKIPFPPPSKILKARTEDDKEYPYYLAMQKLVQMCGRIMRSRADQGENFLGDDHAEWFIPRYGHLAPRSFHAFFRQVSVIPPPPPPLERR